MIPFNRPFLPGNEIRHVRETVRLGTISGNGISTQRGQDFLKKRYGFRKCRPAFTCMDALEMAAIPLDTGPGDETIMSNDTFVSAANAFALRGAKIVLADNRTDQPGIDEDRIENLVTPRTKAIVDYIFRTSPGAHCE